METIVIDESRSDGELARAWEAGDERGFEALVSRYAPLVHARCRRALGPVDADDAAQAVFLVLAQRRANAAASPVLAAWLMSVTTNVLRNALRDRRRRERVVSEPVEVAVPAEESDRDDSWRKHLDSSLAELPRAEREAVVLHHLAGHSLAEVAEHTRAGLSTVKDRLRRGLDRLRQLLGERGVALGVVPLVAKLGEEASAPIPASALARLRELHPIAAGTGTTAALAAHVISWSRIGHPLMTTLSLASATLLLIAGAVTCSLSSAEHPTPTASLSSAPRAADAPADLTPADIDPTTAKTLFVFRLNDGPRTRARLASVPEMAFAGDADASLAMLGAIRDGVVLVDTDPTMSEEQRIRHYRAMRDGAGLPRAEQIRLMSEETKQLMQEGRTPGAVARGPTMSATFSVDDAPAFIADLAKRLDGQLPFGLTATSENGSLVLGGSGHTALRASTEQGRVVVREEVDGTPQPGPAAPSIGTAAHAPDADLEIDTLLDVGGGRWATISTMALTCAADGVRFTSDTPHSALNVWMDDPSPRLPRARFDEIPSTAILAAGAALTPDSTRDSMFWQSVFNGLALPLEALADHDPSLAHTVTAIHRIAAVVAQVDGAMVGWIEPGAPMPTITIQADLPRAAADEVFAALGATVDDQGEGSVFTPVGAVSLGWKDGRLTVTTRPGGASSLAGASGFTEYEDVRKALREMPAGDPSTCVLVRPVELVAAVEPFLAMAAPQQREHFAAYKSRLVTGGSYGYFASRVDATGQHAQAHGLIAVIAAGMVLAQLQTPHATN